MFFHQRLTIMHQNVGFADRMLRILLAAFMSAGLLARGITGPLFLAWMTIPLLLLITGASGYCPLYGLLGISTYHPTLKK
ncbi:DUF2892 domain-containing protein [Hymenobacter humi]|uniref:DUF2892 domain-containing protein n=1 Tax=Hymenobacter humi TaxID=1411620 RepID=A0ABW2UBU0_9BACT